MTLRILAVLFLAGKALFAGALTEDQIKISILTLATYEALELPDVMGINQRQDGKRYTLSIARVKAIAAAAWYAAPLNPRFGDRMEAARRLICAAYHESGFVPNAIHHNRNKTIDIGLLQVNQVHWWPNQNGKSTWKHFAQCNGIDTSLDRLCDVGANMLFAAFVNEMLLRQHKRGYVYNKRPDVKAMYEHISANT